MWTFAIMLQGKLLYENCSYVKGERIIIKGGEFVCQIRVIKANNTHIESYQQQNRKDHVLQCRPANSVKTLNYSSNNITIIFNTTHKYSLSFIHAYMQQHKNSSNRYTHTFTHTPPHTNTRTHEHTNSQACKRTHVYLSYSETGVVSPEWCW